ncbi:beta-N-acetylhexosaminidase [Anseongella ginsenosidimutans]|nr:beta-N-acetylhexosaminidase [Anseongella ginsenosidimutans]
MKKKLFFRSVILICLFSSSALIAQDRNIRIGEVLVIPEPLQLQMQKGDFTLSSQSRIYVDGQSPELKAIGEQLAAHFSLHAGLHLRLTNLPLTGGVPAGVSNAIFLTMAGAADSLGEEGYSLNVRPESITIKANTPQGIFYGVQSLYQLLPRDLRAGSAFAIPSVSVIDKPRFVWRGMMLDAGRYFYSVDFIKKFIDYLAMHKMNTFHWHLTEDHGWRIEIKKYPRLTEIGATREGTQRSHSREDVDRTPHSGYYSQEEIREVVAYAKQRYVTVVPEIEMPGHSLAALAAYPELSCTGGPFEMPLYWGIRQDIFCAGNEATFHFLEDVLSEVAALFPSQIIHIGGDEAPKARWKACPKCQARMKAEGLKDEHELQSYFIKRIEKFLQTKNKSIIGWDEILEGGLAPNAAVMSWRGISGGIAAARQEHDVVMSPTDFMYFDYYQGKPETEPLAIGGFVPLEKVYSYEPVPAELSPDEARFIRGFRVMYGANLFIPLKKWSTWPTRGLLHYRKLPGRRLQPGTTPVFFKSFPAVWQH